MKPWLFGNTTVRDPQRLVNAAEAVRARSLDGAALLGPDGATRLYDALTAAGVCHGDDASLGPKWRGSALKLGVYRAPLRGDDADTLAWNADAGQMTPNGRGLLVDAPGSVPDFFLRALAVYQIPSALDRDKDYRFAPFRPFGHVVRVMAALERRIGDSRIDEADMALVLQMTTEGDADELAQRILALRERRAAAPEYSGKQGLRRLLSEVHDALTVAPGTALDYADTNIRHLAATGVFLVVGRALRFNPDRRDTVQALCADTTIETTELGYVRRLAEGWCASETARPDAEPTGFWAQPEPVRRAAAVHGHNRVDAERAYADLQSARWPEIAAILKAIEERRLSVPLPDGGRLDIPHGALPPYLEWAAWRGVLALGGLTTAPHDTRRFYVDQDFLPVCHAPPNGPDALFHYAEFSLALEVSLLVNSRQEAAEGESVRRHVAMAGERIRRSRPVYGLFLAPELDPNAVESLRRGVWYHNDRKMILATVPMTIRQFREVMSALFEAGCATPEALRAVLDECLAEREAGDDARRWRDAIQRVVRQAAVRLRAAGPRAARWALSAAPMPSVAVRAVEGASRPAVPARPPVRRGRRERAASPNQLAFDLL